MFSKVYFTRFLDIFGSIFYQIIRYFQHYALPNLLIFFGSMFYQIFQFVFYFFRGTTNTFTFSCKHLGKLRSITVGACEREDIPLSNAYGKEAQWLCKKISITDTVTGDK